MDYGAETAGEQFRALWRAAIATAYAHQVVRGHSIDSMSATLNRTPEAIVETMMVGGDTSLSEISDLCFAMDCEPEFETVGGKFVIGVHPNPPRPTDIS